MYHQHHCLHSSGWTAHQRVTGHISTGYLGINSGIDNLEDSFDELREYILVARRFYGTGVCHVPVPVVDNKFSLRVYIAPGIHWSWICRFLELLHYNICCYLWRFPYWCNWILIMTLHLTYLPCGKMSWTVGGTWIQKMCLPIDINNQLLSCIIHLSGNKCIYDNHKKYSSCIK